MIQTNDLRQIALIPTQEKAGAIGEIGLDFSPSWSSGQNQIELLKKLDIATSFNLPVVIHDREAYEEILKILGEISFEEIAKQTSKNILYLFNHPFLA
ncbi:MAG: TatD family hydrolase [Deltaproteobacteria bacterium]|nr:MAG: TatD family hydrolase [Deltaproteobacteria bacterium]